MVAGAEADDDRSSGDGEGIPLPFFWPVLAGVGNWKFGGGGGRGGMNRRLGERAGNRGTGSTRFGDWPWLATGTGSVWDDLGISEMEFLRERRRQPGPPSLPFLSFPAQRYG